MNAILNLIDASCRWTAAIGSVLVVGIAVLIISEVIARSIFGISLSFAWEYAAYFFASAVFLGAGYTMRTGGHVRVALLKGVLTEKGRKVMEFLASVIGAGLSGFLAYALISFAWRSFTRGSTSPTIEATPLVVPQSVLAIGATLLALQMLARVIRLIVGEPPEDDAAREDFTVE